MDNWIQILIRSTSLFILSLFFVRVMGKRNITRANPFSLVSYVVIGIVTALIATNVINNFAFGLITLGVWVILSIVLDYLSIKSKVLHDLINGKETVLIKQGKIMEENLMQVRLTGEELLRELRYKNAFNLADVEFAVMEDSGDINVFMKSEQRPVSPDDLGIKVAHQTEPQTVILDGTALNEPLASLGLNQKWLEKQLENAGVSLDNVFMGQVNTQGELYLDLFDDALKLTQEKAKEMIYANLEKSQADLLSYSLETQDEKAKIMYSNNAQKLKDLIKILEPYLLR